MRRRLTIFLGVASLLFASCNNSSLDGFIVAVELTGNNDLTCEDARLIAIDPGKPEKTAIVLTKEFLAACAPSLSYDGRYLLFQGKKVENDPWQIWVMDLHRNSTSRVTDLPENCTDPLYLPDGTIAFSRTGSVKKRDISTIFKCNMDGSNLQQLTFHPSMDLAASVLKDGRILFTSSQQYPDTKDPVFLVMRPDGTKTELFYRGCSGAYPVSRGIESEEGHIYFIESDSHQQGSGNLITVNQDRPLNSRHHLSEGIDGDFRAVIPSGKSRCFVSYRPSPDKPFALYEFDTGERKVTTLLYQGKGHVTELVWIRTLSERPRRLPSAVDPENPTGLLMSQDINLSVIPIDESVTTDTVADRIQVIGLEGMMSTVKVENDGSFYLKIDADTPFRIQTINKKGDPVRGPSDWIWLRPNERRGCVGCHADPELAPYNRVPQAVTTAPVVISEKQEEISKVEVPEK